MDDGGGKLVIAGLVALVAIVGYFIQTESVENPFTGQSQRVALSPEQEVSLGYQAAPRAAQQFGGLERDEPAQQLVDRVGRQLVERTRAGESPYRFQFDLLDDGRTVNAFALPGGPIFITDALYDLIAGGDGRMDAADEAELAGILAHEIGHVVGRHSSEQIAKSQLVQGLAAAGAIALSDEEGGARREQQLALLAGQMVNMRFSREHENESDALGVDLLIDAGYDPRALASVMQLLGSQGGPRPPEFFSTHPNPENRIEHIRTLIAERFPDGVPAELTGGPDEAGR